MADGTAFSILGDAANVASLIQIASAIVWAGIGAVGGATYASSRPGASHSTLEHMLITWRSILTRLTDSQKARLEEESPGIVNTMITRLTILEQYYAVVTRDAKVASFWQRWKPSCFSKLGESMASLEDAIRKADEDFSVSTRSIIKELIESMAQDSQQGAVGANALPNTYEMNALPTPGVPTEQSPPEAEAVVNSGIGELVDFATAYVRPFVRRAPQRTSTGYFTV